jgi:hypothetical protein
VARENTLRSLPDTTDWFGASHGRMTATRNSPREGAPIDGPAVERGGGHMCGLLGGWVGSELPGRRLFQTGLPARDIGTFFSRSAAAAPSLVTAHRIWTSALSE